MATTASSEALETRVRNRTRDPVEVVMSSEEAREMLIRIDERTTVTADRLEELTSTLRADYARSSEITLLSQEINSIKEDLELVKKHTVNKQEFAPIRLLVYSTIGIVGAAVITAVLASILKNN
jgi:hypothetical protein